MASKTLTRAMDFSLDYAAALSVMPSQHFGEFGVIAGKRYDKVVGINLAGGQSAHAFVDRTTGDVYKAAGWSAPAKIIKGNLRDEDRRADLLARAEKSSGYLYSN